MYAEQLAAVLDNAHQAHQTYYASEVFGGPSLYFHLRALKDGRSGDLDKFAESSYGMLTAWGMHRMGRGGAKMTDFERYRRSLGRAWQLVRGLRAAEPDTLQERDWEDLQQAFLMIEAMRSSFSLVANSKVLAHALPELIPPVDRQYTISFLNGGKVPKDIAGEWNLLRSFLEGFFYPALRDRHFTQAQRTWSTSAEPFVWDTSGLKIVDNLLVGHVRSQEVPADRISNAARSDALDG